MAALVPVPAVPRIDSTVILFSGGVAGVPHAVQIAPRATSVNVNARFLRTVPKKTSEKIPTVAAMKYSRIENVDDFVRRLIRSWETPLDKLGGENAHW